MNDPVVIAAALLHDTFEDTRTAYDEVRSMFGTQVADVVIEVTDVKFLATQACAGRQGRACQRAGAAGEARRQDLQSVRHPRESTGRTVLGQAAEIL